jgi:prepilin peptidase CpaA
VSTAAIVTLLVATAAAVTDLRTSRIPNGLTFGAAAAALMYHAVDGGPGGLAWACAGWLVGAAVFLPFFALGGMGAGDVKLVAALGAWMGPRDALAIAIATALAGGVVAIIVMLRQRYLATAFANLRLLFAHWRVHGVTAKPDLTLASSTGPRLAYAVPILLGTLGVLLWR